jgi:spore maturation protein CgeB
VIFLLEPHRNPWSKGGQKNPISTLRELGCEKAYWLPYAVDPTVFRELENVPPIKHDVAFIAGLSPDRRRVVKPLMIEFKFLKVSRKHTYLIA